LDQLLKEDLNGERGSDGHMKDSWFTCLKSEFGVAPSHCSFFLELYPSNLENRVGFPPLEPTPGFLWQCVWGVIDHHRFSVRFGLISEIGEILQSTKQSKVPPAIFFD